MRWIDWDDEITAVVLQRSRKFFLTAMKSLTGTVWCLRQFHRCCRTHPKRPHHCCHIPNKVENINHTRLTALFPGLPRWAGTRKVKPIWILLKQETVSGSSISWAICKSASSSRQITTPVPHHSSFLQAGCPSCRPTNSVKALKAVENINHLPDIPYSLQWARHISPKLLLPRWMWAPPNTLFLAVRRVRTPNDTSIGSAVSVVLMTVVTNRHTDAHTLHSCLA